MAQRRMFSPDIVCSDAFLEMPASSRDLYIQLGMKADDDGFVNPRGVMRSAGASEDDLKILAAKRFILPFKGGVIVIKHWKINNLVRKDWYRPTLYREEYEQLVVKENGAYTEAVNDSLTTRQRSIGKVSIDKDIHTCALPRAKVEKPPKEKEPERPYDSKMTRDKWFEGKDEAFQLLAYYFDLKGLWKVVDTKEKLQHTASRYLRAARRIAKAGWSQQDFEKAYKRIPRDLKEKNEWTLETCEKYLTK